MEGTARHILSQPLATLAPKTASGGKIRARRFAPLRTSPNLLQRLRKTRHRGQSRVGACILGQTIGNAIANTIGNAIAYQISQGSNSAAQGQQAPGAGATYEQNLAAHGFTFGDGGLTATPTDNTMYAPDPSLAEAQPGDIVVIAMKPQLQGSNFTPLNFLNLPSIGARSNSRSYNFARPQSIATAPKYISLPANVNNALQNAWKSSFPGGNAQEQGGSIAMTIGSNNLLPIDPVSGNSDSINLSNYVPPYSGEYIAGDYHTHPFDSGFTTVSFGGDDIDTFINSSQYGQPSQTFSLVQSGNEQFLLLKTQYTPSNIDLSPAQFQTAQGKIIGQLMSQQGLSYPQAVNASVITYANMYNLAYYRGENGNFQKVN